MTEHSGYHREREMTPNRTRRAKGLLANRRASSRRYISGTQPARSPEREGPRIAVHAIEVFDYRFSKGQTAEAIGTLVVKPLANELPVFFAVDSDMPIPRESPAQFMEEHANELIRHVRLSPPRGRA